MSLICGATCNTGYAHRGQWLESKIQNAAADFSLDILSYATALLIFIGREIDQYIHFTINQMMYRTLKGEPLGKAELATLSKKAELWSEQLIDISWFMRFVNEGIARQVSAENSFTGRFQGRFLLLQNATCYTSCILRANFHRQHY